MLRTLHCETFYYIGKTKGMFLFIYELLMVNLSELINVLLIRLSYKLIIFSGCVDNHNIDTTVCVHVTVVCGVSHVEHAPHNSILFSKL